MHQVVGVVVVGNPTWMRAKNETVGDKRKLDLRHSPKVLCVDFSCTARSSAWSGGGGGGALRDQQKDRKIE